MKQGGIRPKKRKLDDVRTLNIKITSSITPPPPHTHTHTHTQTHTHSYPPLTHSHTQTQSPPTKLHKHSPPPTHTVPHQHTQSPTNTHSPPPIHPPTHTHTHTHTHTQPPLTFEILASCRSSFGKAATHAILTETRCVARSHCFSLILSTEWNLDERCDFNVCWFEFYPANFSSLAFRNFHEFRLFYSPNSRFFVEVKVA